jgi:hypothetical protein
MMAKREDVSLIVREIQKSLAPREDDARKVSEFLRPYLKGTTADNESPMRPSVKRSNQLK